MKQGFLLVSFLLIQLLISQSVFAQYPMIYGYLVELGVENFDYGDYQEALQYFKKARIINPRAKEPARYIRLIKDVWEKEKIEESQKNQKIVTIADLYKWERGLEKRPQESSAQHKNSMDALGKQVEFILKQNRDATSEIFELRADKQTLLNEIADLKTEIRKLAGQVKRNQTPTTRLFELKEVNQRLRQEIASLENKVEKLRTQRREEQANFHKQLKEEIRGVRQRYTQRLKDVQQKLEKANLGREKIYMQMEGMVAKMEEMVQREAEEEALDKYEGKVKSDERRGKN